MHKTLIIIPCYNEASRFPYEDYCSFFDSSKGQLLEFLFVNDGSKDDTVNTLRRLEGAYEAVQVLDLEQNVGKAEAIRKAVQSVNANEYEYLGYFDADLATPLSEIKSLLQEGDRKTKPYLIIGSRIKILGMTDINRKLFRHYIGRVFATVVSNMLKLPIYDTQCGAKLIHADVAGKLFERPFLSKWLFDVELLFRLKKNHVDFEERVVEVPIKKWEDKDGSKINTTYFIKAPLDLLKIFLRYK